MNTKLLVVLPLLFGGINSYSADAKNSESKPTTVSSSSASPNMQNSANTSAKQNSSASTLSKVIGVANMALGATNAAACSSQCYSCCAQAVLFFAMGAMSFKQASNNAGAAYQSGLTGVDTSAWNNPFGDPNSTSNTTDDANNDKDLAANVNTGKFNEIKKALTTTGINGVRLDPKTGKISDSNTGKTYDSNALGTAKGMADAGFAASDIASVMDAASKAEKAAMKKLGLTEGIGAATAANGYTDDGGSGGTMSGKAGDITDDGSGGRRGLASSGAGVKIPSNQIAGLSKNFNGERIGIFSI
ncbi:MAG: hypothetical protein B7Y39_19320 [Bdellovibrio sp. 28-41-41]|nr:MAG: hypothetical protein B7Y39_19320 [Bdellovibrio sp. 28-41-41]